MAKKRTKLTKKSLRLPTVLCGLGRTLEVICDDITYRWPAKDKCKLYSSITGKELYSLCLSDSSITESDFADRVSKNKADVHKGLNLYKKWHDFESANGSVTKPPRGFLFFVGRATAIKYASDKWTGRTKHFIHDFTKCPKVWVNNKTAPTVLVLSGGKIAVKKEGITG